MVHDRYDETECDADRPLRHFSLEYDGGLIRGITDALGPVGGATMIYTGGSVMLPATIGFPRQGAFDRRYLVAGSVLFAVYEMRFRCRSVSRKTAGRPSKSA